jgi:xanthine phosphoribosyltransferase
MIYYDYDRFKNDIQQLGPLCGAFSPDIIVGIARGGVTLAHALSAHLDIRNLQTLRVESYDGQSQRQSVTISGECDFGHAGRVLIVDDIVDSGKTLNALLEQLRTRYPAIEFKTASIFTKATACIQPDFSLHEADQWINFFWEVDFLKEGSV